MGDIVVLISKSPNTVHNSESSTCHTSFEFVVQGSMCGPMVHFVNAAKVFSATLKVRLELSYNIKTCYCVKLAFTILKVNHLNSERNYDL